MAAADNDLCQWLTPPEVAFPFLDWCRIGDDDLVLDPAAGEGALTPDRPGVMAVELDSRLVPELRYWRPQAHIVCADFLALEPQPVFDVAVLNPPYSNSNEGIFIRQALQWAPRACGLIRTVALHGQRRFLNCWRYVRPTRIAILTQRPRFLGPGYAPTPHTPEADYMAIECVLRPEPLTLEACGAWVVEAEVEWVNWRM